MKNVKENKERIYKVVRYIEQNLDKDILLKDLAQVACFSPFHFQRIFKDIIGETPKQFIIRLRLETAAHYIVVNPEKSILEIAIIVGFQSLEAFSRAFKDYYSISPDNFRKLGVAEKLQITSINRHRVMLDNPTSLLVQSSEGLNLSDLEVKIVKLPCRKFISIQTSMESPEKITDSFDRIKKWAEARDLVRPNAEIFGLIKDYPFFTSLENCRYLACISVDSLMNVSGLHNYEEIPAAAYVTFQISGGFSEMIKMSSFIAHNWLPDNGYKVSLEPAIQIPLKDPLTTPFEENTYQIYLRVQPE